MNIIGLLIILCINIMGLGIIGFIFYRILKNDQKKFEIQMIMGEAQSKMKATMTMKELKEIVNDIIHFTVITEISTNAYDNKQPDELSLLLPSIIEHISSQVELYLSDEIKRQWYIYTSEPKDEDKAHGEISYLTQYIYQSVKIILIKAIEDRKIIKTRAGLVDIPEPETKKKEDRGE